MKESDSHNDDSVLVKSSLETDEKLISPKFAPDTSKSFDPDVGSDEFDCVSNKECVSYDVFC
jgi:hypothetical protein